MSRILDIIRNPLSDASLLQELKSAVLGFWPNRKSNHFPGALPVSIERKNFMTLKKYPYVISLKSDGLRFFMMLHNGSCYMIDRQFNFYPININFDNSIYGQNTDGTGLILDGELIMVSNESNEELTYFVHDCICLFSRDHTHDYLPIRYDAIITAISYWKPENSDFKLVPKKFYKYTDFTENLLESSNHKIDGLIFTPVNKEIGTQTQSTLFKWKFKHTVDLKIIEEIDEYVAYVLYKNRLIKYASVKKTNESFRRQLSQNCVGFVSGAIVECVINLEEECSEPIILRSDKSHPNSLSTVEKTIENAKENITLDEIMNLLREE